MGTIFVGISGFAMKIGCKEMLHLHLQARDEEDEEDDGGRSDTSPPRGLDGGEVVN